VRFNRFEILSMNNYTLFLSILKITQRSLRIRFPTDFFVAFSRKFTVVVCENIGGENVTAWQRNKNDFS
jgi:hypothetical protein